MKNRIRYFFLFTMLIFDHVLISKKNKLTLSMVIRNEANNYLREVLSAAKEYIDEAVIIDDASTDNSVEICYEILEGIPLKIVRNQVSKFSNEHVLRKQQWEETIATNPDWILSLDADQIFEQKFKNEVKKLIDQDAFDVIRFRLYDFWSENKYREDAYWCAHLRYGIYLVRYRPNINYLWKETPQHCGHFPINFHYLASANSDLRLKHFGWAKKEDRIKKYNRYLLLDPGAKYGWKEQYDSILDENPNLVEWHE